MLSHNANPAHSCSKECSQFPALKEFFPPLNFINSIPAQAQKAFKNINIELTCVDVAQEYLAVGSNIGIVYLYDQKKEKLHKLRSDNHTNSITHVKILVSLECLVTVGTKNGTVMAFKVPFDGDAEIEKFTVEDLHRASITAVEWTKNGIKFFSGDSNGVVVCTEIDHLEHQSRSYVLLEEDQEIVQLSYFNMILLISTLRRSSLYFCEKKEHLQIGQKDRKCLGKFGAAFFDCDNGNMSIYASRPGQRIWKADIEGVVSKTLVLKTSLSHPHHGISFRRADSVGDGLQDFQLGTLSVYDPKFLFTWSHNTLVLISLDTGAVESVCGFDSIIDASTCGGEIYVLQGIRHLIRLAVSDTTEGTTSSTLDHKSLATLDNVSVTDGVATVPSDVAPRLLGWFKRKFSDGTASQDVNENLDMGRSQRSHTDASDLPDIVKLNIDFTPVQVLPSDPHPAGKSSVHSEGLSDQIVFHPEKKKAKRRKEKRGKKKVHFPEENETVDSSKHSPPEKQTDTTDAFQSKDTVDSCDGGVLKETEGSQDKPDALDKSISNEDDVVGDGKCDNEKVDLSVLLVDNDEQPVSQVKEEKPLSVKCDVQDEFENGSPKVELREEPYDIDDIYSINYVDKKPNVPEIPLLAASEESAAALDEDANNLISSTDSFECAEYKRIKYGSDWAQYNAPWPVVSLSASDYHVFCVDNQNLVYASNFPVFGFDWKQLRQPGEQIAVSPSEHIIWILYKGTIYAACRKTSETWMNSEWVAFARNVMYISVDDSCGWYITTNGEIISVKGLSAARPYSYPQTIAGPPGVVQVACRYECVWLLTDNYKVYCKSDAQYTKSSSWKEVKLPKDLSISAISFGPKQIVFLANRDGALWFCTGVNHLTPDGEDVWEVESGSLEFESSDDIRKTVMKVVNSALLSSHLQTQYPTIVASSDSGAWHCKQMDSVLYSNQKSVIGHSWRIIIPVGTVFSMKWSLIAAEAVTDSKGIIWSNTTADELFCFSADSFTTNPITVDVPAAVSLKCVVPTTNSVWILSSVGNVYIRREMSKKCPQGVWWQQLDTSQLDGSNFNHISCSEESVWACDHTGVVYLRIGVLNPAPGTCLLQAWIEVDSNVSLPSPSMQKLSAVGKKFPLPLVQSIRRQARFNKVYVGPKSYMVWAISDRKLVYVREGITSTCFPGDTWTLVPSPSAKQLCISGSAVWLLKPSGKIYRRFGITEDNVTGDYWQQIPGKLTYLSVTVNDDLWGIQSESLCCHKSHAIEYRKKTEKCRHSSNVSEDDWEDVMVAPED